MFFHVLRHVDPDHGALVVEEEMGKGSREFGLADTRGPEEEKRTDGPVGVLESGAGAADRRRHGSDRVILPHDTVADALLHVQELLLLALEEAGNRNPAPAGDGSSDVLLADLFGEHGAVLGLVVFEGLGGFGEPLLDIGELTVAQLCGPLEVTVPLGPFGRLSGLLELFLEFLNPGDEVLFLVPEGLHPRSLLLKLGELRLQGFAAFLRCLVLFFRQRSPLDLQLDSPAFELVDFGGQRVDLDPQP